MCYNAAKSWQIGWYNDRKIQLSPRNTAATYVTLKTLVGIADYKRQNNYFPVVMKLETFTAVDYYVAFNRATGVNLHNDEGDNMLTIISTGSNGNSYSQSWLNATLLEGEEHTIPNFGGKVGKNIVVKLLSIDKTTNIWKANVLVKDARVPGDGVPPPTPLPTKQPSKNVSLYYRGEIVHEYV